MAEYVVSDEALSSMFGTILPLLEENQRRWVAGGFADMLGHGGVTAVAKMSGLARGTVGRGASEVRSGEAVPTRIRQVGGGRKPVTEAQPGYADALDSLVEPESRGDPMCNLRWTTKSTRKLAEEMGRQGFPTSHTTVADQLEDMGYSLQAPSKTEEGKNHPDRDAQFRYIAAQVAEHQAAGEPVISVDGKKKELIGNYDNGGREYQPKGEPVRVKDHDFPDPDVPKAVPYGIYDPKKNEGWMTVGKSADTAEFAVAAIERWWEKMGSQAYPEARRLLITADAGGSNGYRTRLWKKKIAEFAERVGLEITICHFPPSTSKWNKIEHRMFSQVTMNWRGRPLESYEVVVNLIGSTTTSTGLRIQAELDERTYAKGVKVSDRQMEELPIVRHDFHGEWNYTLRPVTND
jgi:Rhodopirellula transposase DDE domain